MIKATPFLKWVGGKRQLIPEIENLFPKQIQKSKIIDCYIEPFVGGGALLFHLLSNYNVKKAIINDINPDLILAYKIIKFFPNELVNELAKIEKDFLSLDLENRKIFYYNDLRLKFNNSIKVNKNIDIDSNTTLLISKTALLIALNKTCFNGLFRQNSKGEFNVPFGRYKNPKLLDKKNLLHVSKLLQNVEIYCGSFIDIPLPKEISLIYFDPPYRPLSNSSSFTKYSKEDFNDEDQKELAHYLRKLDKLGHLLILSNSDPKNTDLHDDFFDDLYKGFKINRVSAKRFINSKSNGRGSINELLLTNF